MIESAGAGAVASAIPPKIIPAISQPRIAGSFIFESSLPAINASAIATHQRIIRKIIFRSHFPQFRIAYNRGFSAAPAREPPSYPKTTAHGISVN